MCNALGIYYFIKWFKIKLHYDTICEKVFEKDVSFTI